MNDLAHREMVQKAVKPKFRGNQRLIGKTQPIYPQGVEREFQRALNAYMRLVNETVKEHMPEIQSAARTEQEANRRTDDGSDLMSAIEKAFGRMDVDLDKKLEKFGLRQKLESLANRTRKLSISEWKRAVKSTLGIDILDDYYLGEFYRHELQSWIDENVSLIQSIPKEALNEMHNIVSQGFKTGRTMTSMVWDIRNTYNVKKSSARLLARDQLGKLNSKLAQQQQTDAGVQEYTWRTAGDGRVRDAHRNLNRKRFRWDQPPVVSEPGKPERRCHPGEDYQCRCVAIPVFDISTVDVPATDSTKGGD